MRFASTISALALVIAGGGSVDAAPKPTGFVPAIGYNYVSGNSIDLRLANEAGTAAILVHRGSSTILFDLSHRSQQQIAYAERETLWFRSWRRDPVSGVVSLLTASELYRTTSGAAIQAVDFSEDGQRLLFTTVGFGDAAIRIIDLTQDGAPVVQTIKLDFVVAARWNHDRSAIYFNGKPLGSPEGIPTQIYRVALDGSPPTPFLAGPSGVVYLDADRIAGSGGAPTSLLTTVGGVLGLYPDSGGGPILTFGQGYDGHFDCANARILYKSTGGRREPHVIVNVATGGSTVWSTDGNIRRTDWMPGCPPA